MEEIWALQRSTSDRKVAGVCAAVAGRFGIDPLLVRIVIVLLALTAGLGLFLYGFGWLLLATDADPVPPLHRMVPAVARVPRPTLVVLGVAVTLTGMLFLGQFLSIGFGPVLVVLGVWWLTSGRRRPAGRPTRPALAPGWAPASEKDFVAEALMWRAHIDARVSGVDWRVPASAERVAPVPGRLAPTPYEPRLPASGPVPPGASPRLGPPPVAGRSAPPPLGPGVGPSAPRPPAPHPYHHVRPGPVPPSAVRPSEPAGPAGAAEPRWEPAPWQSYEPLRAPADPPAREVATRRDRRRRLLGLATACLLLGSWALLSWAGASVVVQVGVALLVVGAALVVATWVGRPKGLIPLAVLLILVAGGTTTPAAPTAPVADVTYAPATAAELPTEVDVATTDLTLDLTGLTLSEHRTVAVDAAAGVVRVIVPEGMNVVVTASLIGSFTAPDRAVSGMVDTQWQQVGDPSAPTLTINISLGAGEVAVMTA